MSEDFTISFQKHETQDERRFADVGEKLNKILDNHLSHMEPDIAALKADNKWQMWFLKLIAAGVVGGFIERLYQLLAK